MQEKFQNLNNPGVTYVVPQDLVRKFINHMMDEGAALRRGCDDGDKVLRVKEVREDAYYWGLVFEE